MTGSTPTFATVKEQDAYYKSLAPTFQYKNEPVETRDRKVLLVRNETPFNAEPTLPRLIEHQVTPIPRFFKRNHGPIPQLNSAEYTLTVRVVDGPTKVWTLHELQTQFPQYEVMAALQCAGNRRDGLNEVKPVKGVIWGPGTISNAVWSGVRLRDVLLASGEGRFSEKSGARYATWHVDFQAYGLCQEAPCYGSSVPVATVLDPAQDVLLALGMNGETLPADHGYPCRVVVPGVIGARSVKWLKQITVQPEESSIFFQKRDYKILPPEANAQNLGQFWDKLSALQTMNVQSVICYPTADTWIPPGPCTIAGYAISGGGVRIDRVDVSVDNGKTWKLAVLERLLSSIDARANPALRDLPTTKHWAWTRWTYTVKSVPADAVLVCRAWDANGNTQPENPVWNYRGVMNNSWFRVDLSNRPSSRL
ncbi:hypothetical protein IWQ62_003932 [Dispira parvispora]|uniref:Sulfite oxidase n=1 Tax=Dispira parvispora TaxID=1520584 RepID=A0A9W8ATA1_9FUNG|nr:hypothetical protein IWQ62_003932 [Dispira parvispora]